MNPVFDILISCIAILIIVGIGKLCNRFKIFGVSFGCIWILFIGLLAGQIGISINQEVSTIVKDFSLSVFIFEIGLEVGPKIMGNRTSKSWLISILALSVIALGGFVAVVIGKMADIDLYTLNGIMSGAVSNTPALGAAQVTAATTLGNVPESIAQGYALAYPIGIIGVFAVVLLVKGTNNTPDKVFDIPTNTNICSNSIDNPRKKAARHLLAHFAIVVAGVLLGRLVGTISFNIGNLPAPFVLGNTAGTLFSAIAISLALKNVTSIGRLIEKDDAFCNMGLSLFIATVGLSSGAGFVAVLMSGGYKWVIYGALITLVPCLLILPIAKYVAHLSIEEVCGILTGATTNSPVFAYCAGESANPTEVTRTYACIYPAALLSRILLSQIFVFII